MNNLIYNLFQIREIFHIEFLRWFNRKIDVNSYILKGGVNLRLFFKSTRYSEDMDLDIQRLRIEKVKKIVLEILNSRGLTDHLKSFGIEKIIPPDITKAKQTETTQRFKIHLLTSAKEDLFTKVEFSRQAIKGTPTVETISTEIVRLYKIAPLLVPHYDNSSAIQQKIHALAHRSILQARDIFDLFILISQYSKSTQPIFQANKETLKTAYHNIFMIDFPQFRDTVVAYLDIKEQKIYSSPTVWDEIKLKTANFIEELIHERT